MTRMSTLIGSLSGIVLFLIVGLGTALAYGGYAGLLLAGGTVGYDGIACRALITLGMALGVIGIGSLFAVLGAIAGAAIGSLTRSISLALVR